MGLYVVYYNWKDCTWFMRHAVREDNELPSSVFATEASIAVMIQGSSWEAAFCEGCATLRKFYKATKGEELK